MFKAGREAAPPITNSKGELEQLPPNLLLCILPPVAPDLYRDLKFIGDTDLDVRTQCVVGTTQNIREHISPI